MKHDLSVTDKELLKEMENSLNKYLKAAGGLSNDAFDILSQYNGLLWCEIESQKNILSELVEVEQGDGSPVSAEHRNGRTVPELQEEPNAAVGLYDKVVAFLKGQECDELPWVRLYRYKCYVEHISDFQIKYIEYKSASDQEKNYLLFGNVTKNYSIWKINGEIIGDTAECFEYILNLGEKIGIDID